MTYNVFGGMLNLTLSINQRAYFPFENYLLYAHEI